MPFKSYAIYHILTYLNSSASFHYKCKLLDYTTFEYKNFGSRHQDKDREEWWSTESRVPASWMVPLAAGRGNGGSEFFLNIVDGEINEIILSSSTPGPIPLKIWIDEMQDAYSRLHLIPCPGRVTMDCRDVPERDERDGRITEDQFREQTEDWPTELDVQYVRQVYRDHGWPHAFRRDDATAYLRELLVSIEDENDDRYWEEMSPHDDPRKWA